MSRIASILGSFELYAITDEPSGQLRMVTVDGPRHVGFRGNALAIKGAD